MKTENKQYRLKRWYPSLPSWVKGATVILNVSDDGFIRLKRYNSVVSGAEVCKIPENEVTDNPDFWELIEEKEPLFVTEDGVEVFLNNVELFAVNEIFETASAINFDFDCCKKEGWKLFFHKANADEYIWRSKPQFSYEDIIRYLIHSVCDIEQLNHLVQGFRKLAKERSKQ